MARPGSSIQIFLLLVSMLGLRTTATSRVTILPCSCHDGSRRIFARSRKFVRVAQHTIFVANPIVDSLPICYLQTSSSPSTSSIDQFPRSPSSCLGKWGAFKNVQKRRVRTASYYESSVTYRLGDMISTAAMPKSKSQISWASLSQMQPPRASTILETKKGVRIILPRTIQSCNLDSCRRSFWTWRGGDDKRWDFSSSSDGAAANEEPQLTATTSTLPSNITAPEASSTDSVRNKAIQSTPSAATKDSVRKVVVDEEGKVDVDMAQPQNAAPPPPITTYHVSACTAQGYRTYMEDEFFLSLDGDFAAVFDGHGGRAVSRYLRQNLYANLQAMLPVVATPASTPSTSVSSDEQLDKIEDRIHPDGNNRKDDFVLPKRTGPTVTDYENAVYAALDKVDREVQRISHWSYQGSTAVVIWIHEDRNINLSPQQSVSIIEQSDDEGLNSKNQRAQPSSESQSEEQPKSEDELYTATSKSASTRRTVIAANVGDSRAVLCRDGVAWDLTRDHKPNDPHELERIEKLGGKVSGVDGLKQ